MRRFMKRFRIPEEDRNRATALEFKEGAKV
jgi:hypothetical protein